MRIERGSTIAGIDAKQVRDAMKRASSKHYLFDWTYLANFLHIDPATAKEIIKELISLGYIEKNSNHAKCWEFTIKGNSFSMAKALKPMSRQKANELIVNVMKRVEQVNANKSLLYQVDIVTVFGSFLSDAEYLNDLDLAINLIPVYDDNTWMEISNAVILGRDASDIPACKEFSKRCLDYAQKAQENGDASLHSFEEVLYWPNNEIYRYIKNGSLRISLHDMEQIKSLAITNPSFQYKIIYQNNSFGSQMRRSFQYLRALKYNRLDKAVRAYEHKASLNSLLRSSNGRS